MVFSAFWVHRPTQYGKRNAIDGTIVFDCRAITSTLTPKVSSATTSLPVSDSGDNDDDEVRSVESSDVVERQRRSYENDLVMLQRQVKCETFVYT